METVLLSGIITNTSKKQSGKFTAQNPRKSVYLELDAENAKIAKDFGLTEYTPSTPDEETGKTTPFFIVKASGDIKEYDLDGNVTKVTSGKIDDDSANFTSDGKVIGMSLSKGEKSGNEFIRLYAVLGELVDNAPENPFAQVTQ